MRVTEVWFFNEEIILVRPKICLVNTTMINFDEEYSIDKAPCSVCIRRNIDFEILQTICLQFGVGAVHNCERTMMWETRYMFSLFLHLRRWNSKLPRHLKET
mmetsp:Transcript_31069/g.73225  ORF Transcript_31069/g.73225 Transcript_31069/m.73225 type:complete len:102 (+) Transcript_31069:2657-2962(+)